MTRWKRAALLGSLLAVVLNVVVLTGGEPDLLQESGVAGGVYDAQARALLDSRLDVSPSEAGIEGFRVGGETHVYFGVVPALLRIPVLALTDAFDGRLTQLSMLAALIVLLAATAALQGAARARVRGDAPVTGADEALAFAVQAAAGAGIPLYLAGWPAVYHEAILWGAALAVAAVAGGLAVLARPTPARIALAGLMAALALNTRASVGMGVALALVGCGAVLIASRRRRPGAAVVAVALLAIASSAAVNEARFGQPFGFPIEKQVFSSMDPDRRAALAANDNRYFGSQFAPTALLQASRPDALGIHGSFPFLGLPDDPPPVVGSARFERLDPSLSLLTSMPVLCLLSLVGLAALARRRELWPVAPLVAGTALGAVASLTIAQVTTRFLGDLLPLLALCAAVGAQALPALERPALRRPLAAGLAALLALGAAVNAGAAADAEGLADPGGQRASAR